MEKLLVVNTAKLTSILNLREINVVGLIPLLYTYIQIWTLLEVDMLL